MKKKKVFFRIFSEENLKNFLDSFNLGSLTLDLDMESKWRRFLNNSF